MPKKRNIHYVNNADFSHAVVEYVKTSESAKKKNKEVPKVTDYIATCFLKIAEGLSHKANFIRYTYREEMVMDAVENCIKAIMNYDITKATRTGLPNAFGEYDQTPKELQELIEQYLKQNLVNIIGGCCGTTPDHIRLISEIVKKYTPRNP